MKIIAEFCQNHNGSYATLEKMVINAKKSGATHGKIQNIFAKNLTFRPQFEQGLKSGNKILAIKRPYLQEYKRLKELEINYKYIKKFLKLCNDEGITPMTTCFAHSDAIELKKIGFKSIKVASYDCSSYPMLNTIKKNFKEIIVSTGAMFDDEIVQAYQTLKRSNFSFLHCITIYPTPLRLLNLNRMNFLKKFSKTIGFSDHTLINRDGLLASKCAIYLGAKIIERHFTILPQNKTKDGPVSINPHQLKELKNFSLFEKNDQLKIIKKHFPQWQIVKGKANRDLSSEEVLNRDYYRGRFASLRKSSKNGRNMIFNWESYNFG